jgi:hypothetical protein
MDSTIKGVLASINIAYRIVEHNGRRFTKSELTKVLHYGLKQGYDLLSQITDSDIHNALSESQS